MGFFNILNRNVDIAPPICLHLIFLQASADPKTGAPRINVDEGLELAMKHYPCELYWTTEKRNQVSESTPPAHISVERHWQTVFRSLRISQ